MKCLRKIKGQSGFSLAETLLAVLILLLVSVLLANGVPMAKNVYEKVVLGANAHVMLSTAVDTLRSEIGTAWKVNVSSNTTISYFSAGTGWQSQIKLAENTPIKIQEYIKIEDDILNPNPVSAMQEEHSLVPDNSSRLYVDCKEVKWLDATKKDIIVFSEINVKKKEDDKSMATLDSLEIRVISGSAI